MKAVGRRLSAAALIAAVAGCSQSNGDPTGDPVAAPTDAGPPECPPPPEEGVPDPIDEPDLQAGLTVPEDATSVRLCQGPGLALDGAGELLTKRVDELVAAVNGMNRTMAREICTEEVGQGFRLVFGYDDGSTFIVSGKAYGCRTLTVGSSYRVPAHKALKTFRRLAR